MGLWRAPGGTLEGPQQYHTEGLWHHTVGVCLDGPPRAAKGASGAAAGAAGAAVGGSGTAARASGRPLRLPGILGGGPVFVPPLGWGARERRFPQLHLGVGAWCPFRARSLQHPANAARGASCARARAFDCFAAVTLGSRVRAAVRRSRPGSRRFWPSPREAVVHSPVFGLCYQAAATHRTSSGAPCVADSPWRAEFRLQRWAKCQTVLLSRPVASSPGGGSRSPGVLRSTRRSAMPF